MMSAPKGEGVKKYPQISRPRLHKYCEQRGVYKSKKFVDGIYGSPLGSMAFYRLSSVSSSSISFSSCICNPWRYTTTAATAAAALKKELFGERGLFRLRQRQPERVRERVCMHFHFLRGGVEGGASHFTVCFDVL